MTAAARPEPVRPPRPTVLPAGTAPRGFSRVQAAEYVGVGPTKFDELVRDGRMPPPKRIDGRKVWDRIGLDAAFAALPDDGDAGEDANPWDAATSA